MKPWLGSWSALSFVLVAAAGCNGKATSSSSANGGSSAATGGAASTATNATATASATTAAATNASSSTGTPETCIGSNLMSSLGKTNVMVGVSTSDTVAASAPFDIRY